MTLNTARLDYSLQYGSDPTASKSALPLFVIEGDGGAATYDCQVDGQAIGQFRTSDMYGRVNVQTKVPLSDGPHTLTFQELAPKPGNPTTPFAFSVDTVSPNPPVITNVFVGSPSGSYPITVQGTSAAFARIAVYNGPTRLGGTTADGFGRWTAALIPQPSGTYGLTAAATDQAGNVSARSGAWPLTVGSPPPPPPPPPPPTVPNAPVAGTGNAHVVTLQWTNPADGGSAITGYVVTYSVQAVNSVGASVASGTATVTVGPS